MKTNLFDYPLPQDRIAQRPLAQRDGAKMLVLDRKTGRLEHSRVRDLPQWLLPRDLMVVNRTKVIPARLFAVKPETGAELEVFLLRPLFGGAENEWEVLISPAKRVRETVFLSLKPKGEIAILESLAEGHFIVRFNKVGKFGNFLKKNGHVPLPPYIKRPDEKRDRDRYQTLFAKTEGSLAAPTAGLHFTKPLLENLRKKGVRRAALTLHVGLGTFLPVSSEETEDHRMHPEWMDIPSSLVSSVAATKKRGGRVVAIGTTVARALESAALEGGGLKPGPEETRIFITPGYAFKTVDALFTNFHQPHSTLLMMVSAFAGRERVLAAYEEALKEGYRFLSYGDAMLIL